VKINNLSVTSELYVIIVF